MKYQAYVRPNKLIGRMPKSNNEFLNKSNERNSKSNNAESCSLKLKNDNFRNNSNPKEIPNKNMCRKLRNDENDLAHADHSQNYGIVDLRKYSNSPIYKSGKFQNIAKSKKFIDFKNKVLNKKEIHLKNSFCLFFQQDLNKSNDEINLETSKIRNKSLNPSYNKNLKNEMEKNPGSNLNTEFNPLVDKNFPKSKSNFKLMKEINSPEDLHYFYLNILRQNKKLAFKFERLNLSENNEEFEL